MPDYRDRPDLRVLMEWQERLHKEDPRPEDRRVRALFRRCRTLDDVRVLGPFYHFARECGVVEVPPDGFALLTLLLPHLKKNTDVRGEGGAIVPGPSLARVAGTAPPDRTRARMSDLRFRRLIQYESPADLAGPLVRALRLAGGEASLSRLAHDLRFWHPNARRHPRIEWAHDYYTALLPDSSDA